MKTTISRESFLKTCVLLLTISAFVLSTLLLSSCSDTEGVETSEEDTALIAKIESATKTVIESSSLPAEINNAFLNDLADSYTEKALLADGLGYQLFIATDNESREEAKSEVFFSLKGKQLNDTNEKRRRHRNKCFEFVFPIDFIMPDNSSITLNSKDDWTLIRTWYEENPDATERPELVFPINVTLKEDGSTQTLIDREDLIEIKNSCKRGKDKRKCFRLILPVTFTMPDGSEITVTEKPEFKLIREWHKANPTIDEKGSLNFPVDIFYKDGTTETIDDQTAFDAAKESCKN